MIKIAALSCIVLASVLAKAQQAQMKVELTQGDMLTYDIDSIEAITFNNRTATPESFSMEVHTNYLSSVHPHPIERIDSIAFEGKLLSLYKIDGKSYFYPVVGNLHVDSIVFVAFAVNTKVISLFDKWDYTDCDGQSQLTGYPRFSYWSSNWKINVSSRLAQFSINPNFHLTDDTTFCPSPLIYEFSANNDANKFLFVKSNYINVAMGRLYEYIVASGKDEPLLDEADSNVGFSLYLNADSIIYYSYGESITTNPNPPDAGYYVYNKITHQKTLLLHYVSDVGPNEMLNSFDISPDGRKLLIAAVGDRRPFLIEYDLETNLADSLHLDFPDIPELRALYIKYDHSGSKVVYSIYPFGTLTGEVNVERSNLGIIDLQSRNIKELNTQPSSNKNWLSLWPSWSPDDSSILYIAGLVSEEPFGSLNTFYLCILKALE